MVSDGEKRKTIKVQEEMMLAVVNEQTHADSRDKAVGILLENDVQCMNFIPSNGQSND